jgi:hypothetical protein
MSDTGASEAVVMRLDWKIALHLPIEQNRSFDPSTLCYFRKRLKENDKMSLIAGYYEKEIPEDIKERYGGRFSSFGMLKEKRGEKLAEIVEDGLYLKWLLEEVTSNRLQGMKQHLVMETIFEENVKVRSKEIEDKVFVEVEEIQTPKQTILDPRDLSIKLGIKGGKKWVGSKCHVVETAENGKINFITDMIYQKSNEDDSRIHGMLKEGNERRGLKPDKVYADTNYINGVAIGEYRKNGQELMGYAQGDSSKRRPEAFKLQSFDVDIEGMKAICPGGKKSCYGTKGKDGIIRILLSESTCKDCIYYKECIGATRTKKKVTAYISG